jgi:hypothetical protein
VDLTKGNQTRFQATDSDEKSMLLVAVLHAKLTGGPPRQLLSYFSYQGKPLVDTYIDKANNRENRFMPSN